MRILVGVCIIAALALLGCYLPDNQEQAVKTFFENSESSDMGSDEIVTEGIFSSLKLYASEHHLLVEIKKTLISLKDPNYRDVPPVRDYNEEYFNKFFLDLGSERSKDLIKLFGRVKNEQNNKFKSEVYWLYSCISELYSLDIKYSGEEGSPEYDRFMPRPTAYQQYLKVKREIERNTINGKIL
ncbi:P52 family lipoprotein [Borreliella burgdorferi]|uniref:Outer membrane protein n=5 Tax=Borreliella burgdorferi TaxID=139 RepID=A0A7U4DIY0_BORBG|nr:P52 family lipoprotein [Borreliella burgdorferi]AAB02041.1 unknown [Borreliella burgdorferi 297]ACL33881.1 outer membrane protein [Borreliella burgdorferi 156a]ACM10235.1 outer membrane protein [Borreliella burgdorferi 72a]ACN92215.1 outer membrane protein [Borreliella burgdorferi 94a]ACN92969.1 outer membrane protein [Borreliella burgdorferi 118a]